MIIVDRIINSIAVCEADGVTLDIPLTQINGNVREGDMLRPADDGSRYTVDARGTNTRRAVIAERFERIKKTHKG